MSTYKDVNDKAEKLIAELHARELVKSFIHRKPITTGEYVIPLGDNQLQASWTNDAGELVIVNVFFEYTTAYIVVE